MVKSMNCIMIPDIVDCEAVNRYISGLTGEVSRAELMHPVMSQVIYCYIFAQYANDCRYEEKAGSLLDLVLDGVSWDLPVCLKEGLLGVGCGLIYLLRNNFVTGDEDEVLFDIDQSLFTALVSVQDDGPIDWYGWLYYSRKRISLDRSSGQPLIEYTLRVNVVSILERFENEIRSGQNCDGRIVAEVEELHAMKLCPDLTSELLFQLNACLSSKVTLVIPVRIDSMERERNLDYLLSIFTRLENIEIFLVEGDKKSLYNLKHDYPNVKYTFVPDLDQVFHRTKYLNWLIKQATGNIVGVWDTDVLVPGKQILAAINAIATGRAVMSFPYDGSFNFLNPEISSSIIKDKPLNISDMQFLPETYYLIRNSFGGAFFVNKEAYLDAGGENEHFYGWGPEDRERVRRLKILGLSIYRSSGPLFHLYHPRNENSMYVDRDMEFYNKKEYLKICSMGRDELKSYINTWPESGRLDAVAKNWSFIRKSGNEFDFWKAELERYKLWYSGALSPLYNTLSPMPEERVVHENSLYSCILTWTELHQKPKYLSELKVDASLFTGKRVLDVGAGPIPSATCFEGCELYALDPLMSVYRDLGFPHELYQQVHFIDSPAEDLPFEDNFFDAIISVNAIDHVDNLYRVAQELKRVAKEDCLFAMHVNYHKPTICEPVEINDDIFNILFGWVQGLKALSRSKSSYSSPEGEEDEYVLWSNINL